MLSSTWSIPSSTHPKARTWMPTKFFLLATGATRPRRPAGAVGAAGAAGVARCAAGGVAFGGAACERASCAIRAADADARRRKVLRSRRGFMGSSSFRGQMGDIAQAGRVSRAYLCTRACKVLFLLESTGSPHSHRHSSRRPESPYCVVACSCFSLLPVLACHSDPELAEG